MATNIKGLTIASTYQDLVKRDSGTYSQTGMNIEIQNDSGTALATGLYLESGATTDNVGIGIAAPTAKLHIEGANPIKVYETGSDYQYHQTGLDLSYLSTNATIDDGFGPSIGFSIKDSGGTLSQIGMIGCVRDTADTKGKLIFGTYDTGTQNFNTTHQRMVIDNTGNVGIGADSPGYLLTLEESSTASTGARISLKNTNASGSGSNFTSIYMSDHDAAVASQMYIDSNGTGPLGRAGTYIGSFTNNDVGIFSNNLERMTIDNGGNVGIGIDAPATYLHINGNSNITSGEGTHATSGHIILSNSQVRASGVGSSICWLGSSRTSSTTANYVQAEIVMCAANGTDQRVDGMIKLRVKDFWDHDGGGAAWAMRDALVINHTGNVGIGVTDPDSPLEVAGTLTGTSHLVHINNLSTASTADCLLLRMNVASVGTSNNFITFNDDGATIDEMEGDGSNGVRFTGTAQATYSDSRIKTNIADLSSGLDKINALTPKTFDFTDEFKAGSFQTHSIKDWQKKSQVGFVAQEFKTVFPDLVQTDKRAVSVDSVTYDGKDYTEDEIIEIESLEKRAWQFEAYLVKAIQELSAKVTALENA